MGHGIRISKDGIDVNKALTETNKKDFVFLSDEPSVKVYFAGFTPAGGDYTHNLGKVPMFFGFTTSDSGGTHYTAIRLIRSTTTQITSDYVSSIYLIILNEGL